MALFGLFGGRQPARRGNPNALSSGALAAAGIQGLQVQGDPSLTAAGFRITHQDADTLRRLIQPWQSRSFSYYDQLGEIKYAAQFYARMLAPLRLYPAQRDENDEWVETDDPDAVDALDRIQDPGGGRESLLSAYGRLMFLVGEALLFCSIDEYTGEETWEMLSTDELRVQSGVYIRYKAPSLLAEEFHETTDDVWDPDERTAIAFRLWKRHPRWSYLADATMQGVLESCEELLLLSRAIRARARSRLAGSGILGISEDFSYAPLEATPDEDPKQDPFLADLTAAMTLPITNEGTASAVVPLVVRGPTEAIDKGIKHIQIVDPTQLYPETGLRYELIKRIALGLDMPPEILLGMSDANHWTSWQISEETWRGHGQPIANQLVNDLNASYFRPYLKSIGVDNYMDFGIAYDATAIVTHPDRTKDAKDLYDKRAIGKETLRREAGFGDDDAPTEDELAEMVGVATHDSSLAWDGVPSVKAGGVETAPGEIVSPAGNASSSDLPPGADSTGATAESGPPESDSAAPVASELVGSGNGSGNGNGNGHHRLDPGELARIVGAADMALLRAREVAGNRLKSYAKRDSALLAILEGTSARDIAAILGPEKVRSLGVDARVLLEGSTELLRDTLRIWEIGDEETLDLIIDRIQVHAARTLFDLRPAPLPPQFAGWVEGLVVA